MTTDELNVEVQYASYAIGVFGPRGQNAKFFATEVEAWRDAHNSQGAQGPGMRKSVTINGEQFFTEWVSLATTRWDIDEWVDPDA